jgi:DNA/RNA-binding domain of Phe-tRNA-synthetase-like protein
MDAELKQKKLVADAALSRCQPEDREAVLAYVAALEVFEVQYHVLRRSIEELTRQLIQGEFLGPHLVERRTDGRLSGAPPSSPNGASDDVID